MNGETNFALIFTKVDQLSSIASDYTKLENGEKSNSYTKIAKRSYMKSIDNSMSKGSNNFSNHAEMLL